METSTEVINDAIRSLDWNGVQDSLLRDEDVDPDPIEVCTASVDDWNRYVRSPNQAMKPKYMEWRDGRIWIVECAGAIDSLTAGKFIVAMCLATGTGDEHLEPYTDCHDEEPPAGAVLAEPDCSFGPSVCVGAVLPDGIGNWLDFQTVNVEVGVCQGWPGLDRKSAIWREHVGVQFVVSIRLSPKLRIRQFQFEERVNGEFPVDDALNRAPVLPIDQQHAMLRFDAHRLLGLPAGANLPSGFNNPVEINLFQLVEQVRQRANA
ncbi:hypothetical protein PHYSODRAFT_338853 [Phytophthora sojae]|uniref:Uncharacterized protein n=1 Tax=Phytophthora sojae (strain P6497) TaxID=1094619 RepID=G5A3F4_PHYSP|nr:hypothetical protein PHYSODRAFT_338853 [Phytophthora sojae]EGZ10170.1 hypothetical protein PHYSODRAFT_338853 [Phytophthora sojae]|eukprot:XP_009535031.1 hypothetical protein PHYSODRAFT_338853 [Phytophthora sojae]